MVDQLAQSKATCPFKSLIDYIPLLTSPVPFFCKALKSLISTKKKENKLNEWQKYNLTEKETFNHKVFRHGMQLGFHWDKGTMYPQ